MGGTEGAVERPRQVGAIRRLSAPPPGCSGVVCSTGAAQVVHHPAVVAGAGQTGRQTDELLPLCQTPIPRRRRPPPPPPPVPPATEEPDVEELPPAERALLNALGAAWDALLARQTGAHPSLATDDLVRAVGASAHTRDVLLLTYLRDAGGDVPAAVAALAATLTWRRERRVTTVPASAVDVPAACGGGGGGGGASPPGGRRQTPPLGGRYARRATAIVDFSGWSAFRNVDLPTVKVALKLFFAHYPNRHGRILLMHYPAGVHTVYRAISPLLSASVVRQIVWVGAGGGESTVSVLRREVGASRLPRWLGGTPTSRCRRASTAPRWPRRSGWRRRRRRHRGGARARGCRSQ
ncbi:hypothetical protein BU14_0615s0006 [Porphyra umbilicalis]|uniref:CRAL-TRIO domain-containing protein n=1 Tax=Porphyra umbilicalis TaxID=2786 RepID=A0A1X6NR13_PORUM|nr:hypothetical protein BU14_0615s0006 [Porphyra umbilicalis]|eukprot:OSX71017.1 hypothetical protein BU14_0615s0006 [Porphyra umbilicalis]